MANSDIIMHITIDGEDLVRAISNAMEEIGRGLREQARKMEPIMPSASYLKGQWVPPGVRDNRPLLQEPMEWKPIEEKECDSMPVLTYPVIRVYGVAPDKRWYLGEFHRATSKWDVDVFNIPRVGPQKLVDIMRGLMLRNKSGAFHAPVIYFQLDEELVGLGQEVREEATVDCPGIIATGGLINNLIKPDMPLPGVAMPMKSLEALARELADLQLQRYANIGEIEAPPKWEMPPAFADLPPVEVSPISPDVIEYDVTTEAGTFTHKVHVEPGQRYVRLPHVFTHNGPGVAINSIPVAKEEAAGASGVEEDADATLEQATEECKQYCITPMERAVFLAHYKLKTMGFNITADVWEDWIMYKRQQEEGAL